ncbi:MAG TPA: hypothetical protein VJ063_03595 [Verrucomicrobiae bacterium]|nr:hypothetical protein [Verrucomicrobiae bacterium]
MSESVEVVCPKCHSQVPLENVNVANDIALCRKCAYNFSFADALSESEIEPVDLSNPPKGVWYKRFPNGFELGSSTRSAAAFFLVPFMLIWSGGSLGGIYGTQIVKGHFSLGMSLFGLPFLFGSIVLGSMAIMTVCGKFCVRAEGNDGEVFVGVGSIGYRKKFPWDQVRDIRLETKRNSDGGAYKQLLIAADNPIKIPNIPDSRVSFFLAALRQLHRDLFAPATGIPPKVTEAA